ncbi:magnesium transporter [Psychromarinibacter sp. C21-152]|uniref:Magnesium transporter n=1 Tax=Psychromarinibacter sediminicola TaxID=3033385 RepID=A0AAE3T925_9RHOB|nr:magnesium transporter [Psychromarinibacter sediminicola]MDF0602045.1 magnesium transporter [Psychromarinibacter sediminicola]
MPDTLSVTHAYTREAAAAHMLTSVPTARPGTPVEDVIADLRGQAFRSADTVFVVDADGHLEGIVRINDLFAATAERIGEIMEPEHEAVRADDDQEEIAALAIRLGMIAVPVVDAEGRLIGAVPPEALFRILRDEHMEDLQRLAGIGTHAEGPGAALDAPILDRVRRRLPWLVFGLVASSLVTLVMVGFEHALDANVSVAFFVPALVYIAGAIGTQAVSVSVRALATGAVPIRRLLRDELAIGLAIGLALGVLAAGGVLAVFGDGPLALAVALAVLGGGAVSAVVGFGLPWAFDRLGSDPALGSGPVCTVIQDAASLAIYFLAVSLLVL